MAWSQRCHIVQKGVEISYTRRVEMGSKRVIFGVQMCAFVYHTVHGWQIEGHFGPILGCFEVCFGHLCISYGPLCAKRGLGNKHFSALHIFRASKYMCYI